MAAAGGRWSLISRAAREVAMMTGKWVGVIWLMIAVIDSGCAPGGQRAQSADAGAATARVSTPKRISVGIMIEPQAFRSQLSRSSLGSIPGSQELEQLVNAGLTIADQQGKLVPELAEAVPTVENGLWKVLPDGRMETTWRIKPTARWQDGTPVTADDFVFTASVAQDKDLLLFRDLAFDSVEAVEAPDPATVLVRWSKPWIEADSFFGAFKGVPVLPLPKHLLATHFAENKASLPDLSYWTTDFVGAGPYRLKQWERGSFLILSAFDNYALGRAKIDEIDVKFVTDTSTMAARALAGDIDMPLGRSLSFEEGMQLRENWSAGAVEFSPSSALKIWPQFRNTNPPIVADARFRRALLHGTDRQAMADGLSMGQSAVANSTLVLGDAEYEVLNPSVVQYPFDPRRAAEILTGLGYTRGADGLRDGSGQRLNVEVRTVPRDVLIKMILTAADDWKKLGVSVDANILTESQRTDREFYSTYPAFDAAGSSNGTSEFFSFHSSQIKTAQNRYTGSNRSGYTNSELDGNIERFFTTVPIPERMQVASQVVSHLTENVVFLPMFYDLTPTMIGNRLVNVPMKVSQGNTVTWNAHLWDVKS
jgi:peptide/nickel transport system substrate-binding protein